MTDQTPRARRDRLGTVLLSPTAVAQAQPEPKPTFNKDVAPIFFEHCTTCHRPGEVAPMSLLTYKDARPWARSIATQVTKGAMPPWHADPAIGHFANARRLTDDQKATIARWVESGAPGRRLEGSAANVPTIPKAGGSASPTSSSRCRRTIRFRRRGMCRTCTSRCPRTSTRTAGCRRGRCGPAIPRWCTTSSSTCARRRRRRHRRRRAPHVRRGW